MVQTKDPRDCVNVFLYDASNKTKLIAWTQPVNDYKTFSVDVKASIKSYQLKIVLDTNDEEIYNNLFTLRLDIEPLTLIGKDLCKSNYAPPQ